MSQITVGCEAMKSRIRALMGLTSNTGIYIANTTARKDKENRNSYFVKVIFWEGAGGNTFNQLTVLSQLFRTSYINCSHTTHTGCSTCGAEKRSFLTFDILKSPIILVDDYVDDP